MSSSLAGLVRALGLVACGGTDAGGLSSGDDDAVRRAALPGIEAALDDGTPVPVLATRQQADELELHAGQIVLAARAPHAGVRGMIGA